MSLIHEALKKAQDKEKAPLGSGLTAFQESAGGGGLKLSKRTIVLAVLVAVALGFLVYKRFSKPSAPPPAPVPALATGAAGATSGNSAGDGLLMKRRAIEAFKTDDLDSALASITSAAQLNPTDPEIWNDKGLIEKKLGNIDGARGSYEEALKLKPDYPEVFNNLAMLELASGQPSQAREYLEKALTALPAYPEANFNMGVIYDKGGDKAQATNYYKRFLNVSGAFPSNVVEAVRDRVMELEP
jgi:Flp pilus assembly protein TadD